MKKIPVRNIAYAAMFIALQIVFDRVFTLSTQSLKINFSFVPIALCGILFGPAWAAAAAAIADFIGAHLIPLGPYFPGFTLTAAAGGAVYGLFLHKRDFGCIQVATVVGINCVLLSFILNSLFVSILYSTPLLVYLPTRVFQCIFMIASQSVILPLLKLVLHSLRKANLA